MVGYSRYVIPLVCNTPPKSKQRGGYATKLGGLVQIDDVYLGGKNLGGTRNRGDPGKTPFVAALNRNKKGLPVCSTTRLQYHLLLQYKFPKIQNRCPVFYYYRRRKFKIYKELNKIAIRLTITFFLWTIFKKTKDLTKRFIIFLMNLKNHR